MAYNTELRGKFKARCPLNLTKSNARLYQPTERMETNCHIREFLSGVSAEKCVIQILLLCLTLFQYTVLLTYLSGFFCNLQQQRFKHNLTN